MTDQQANNLWKVVPLQGVPGMFIGYGLDRLGQTVGIKSNNKDLIEQHLIEMQIPDVGSDLFLEAWKRGIKLAGKDLFHCDAPSIDEATDKNELRPKWDTVEATLQGGRSPAERLFLIELCSFYNNDWMQDWKKKIRMRRSSFCNVAAKLSEDYRQVLADLLVNYRGW